MAPPGQPLRAADGRCRLRQLRRDADWATADVPFTIGVALDLLAPVLFLHVFLAYPSGRLIGRLDRAIVVERVQPRSDWGWCG